jgi:TrmH family RNA methyltransferase
MTRRLSITSNSNDRLKTIRRLRRRRSDRVFLVEGHAVLRHALAAHAVIQEDYAAPDLFLGPADRSLVALAERRGARVLELSASAFASISAHVRPDGLAAVIERWPTPLATLRLPASPLVVVAEAIERPGNLGTIIRTACAAGADALLVCDAQTDVFHPETIRGSVGTLFALPIAEAASDVAVAWLRERGAHLVIATPDGDRPFWKTDYCRATGIVFGNERHGVSEVWRKAADDTIHIPMAAPADSLNVAVAAGVVLFEAARQRSHPTPVVS